MCDLKLIEPTKEHEAQAMEFRQEFINLGEARINGSWGLQRYENYHEWMEIIASLKLLQPSDDGVPSTTYFCMRKSDGKIVGAIQLRHTLNDQLRKLGGHVGYSVRPTERGKDYATKMLTLVLTEARQLNLSQIMLTCHKSNPASSKVIIKNGGVLTGEATDERDGEVVETYLINLK
ncbi:MAG: GNAT family N-acetyltransferase [Defluviitaleaceae bacterium]|nr:GNAT family N-acetyltransferase [Defluviitaleaceae bacterium]